MAPTALSGTSPKSVTEIFHNQSTVSFRIWGRQEWAGEIEKELDESLVRAERFRGAVLKVRSQVPPTKWRGMSRKHGDAGLRGGWHDRE